MTEIEKPFYDICKIMDETVNLSKGKEISHHPQDKVNGLRIWKYSLLLPRKEQENYYFLLPFHNSIIDQQVIESFGPSKYYIIDCFKQYTGHIRATDSRLFFINFLFNSKGYNSYFSENSIFDDIKKLYTKRTISFFNDQDSFKNYNTLALENLLDSWQKSGNKPLLILGERGIGKSWTVLNYCLQHYKKHRENPWLNPLPIYLNLRELSENIPGITNMGELIYYHLISKYNIKLFGGYFLFSALLRSGKIILVFDGLDEMSKEVSKEITIKNIWQVFSIYSNTGKFILTSRINFFNSRIQIKEHFAYQSFLEFNLQKPFHENGIYTLEERRVRQDFNIWEMIPLRDEEKVKFLEKAFELKDERYIKGIEKIYNLSTFGNETVQQELMKLWSIPAYSIPVIKLLANNQFHSLIEIYEYCINCVIIEFNIDTNRAIDKYKTITKDKEIEGHAFEAEQKNEILRKLAWYMLEREIYEFDIVEFPKFIMDIGDIDNEIVLSDLQTQTIITLQEEGKYSFISDGIFSFYVANYLFLLLISENKTAVLRGIQNLGQYDFKEGVILRKTRVFLNAKIDTLTKNKDGIERIKNITKNAEEIFQSDRPYSPWLKYLSTNLKMIGVNVSQEILTKHDFWNTKAISNPNNSTDKKLVLIPGNRSIKPFLLGITEITNKDYSEFLLSNDFVGDDNQEECLGHYWLRKEAFGDKKNLNNPYLEIINYYHIIFWTDDRIPKSKQDHPVVWISWFAAAKFCNWLSLKENLEPFYTFRLKNNKFVQIDIKNNGSGYRLPTESEWIFAASEGDSNAESILDICSDERDKKRIKRKFFSGKIETTSSVKRENPNKYGVYGLMGNVREWVDNPEKLILNKFDEQIIKGMGWLLGEEGFKFKHKSSLIAQNNNVDVGFRIARSLSLNELEFVQNAYESEL
jgi:formylglycine-generating enzyme required for sulfatase activity